MPTTGGRGLPHRGREVRLSGAAWIGVSGWSYPEWEGTFYPRGLPRRRELAFASRAFNSLEVNGSFYSLRRPEDYRAWRDAAPARFLYAVKGSRFITHDKKLRDVETPLANFFASGVLGLGPKLGPFVWQLPGNARFDAARVERFFALLPRDTQAAARLARRHDGRVRGRSWCGPVAPHRLRHAIEVRHESFFDPRFVRLARRFGVAIAISDGAEWPLVEELTAGFVYVRLHGHRQTYRSSYGPASLDRWARRIRLWLDGKDPADARRITSRVPPRRRRRDVYVYFDNTADGHAPKDAAALARRLAPRDTPRGR